VSNDIKAIETEYDGHRFRSRLEARWAVFFNAVGLTYVRTLLEKITVYDDYFFVEFKSGIEIQIDE